MPTHAQLRAVIAADPLRMRCLVHVRALGLPDCWVAAGFVRSAVWDHLHRRGRSALPADIDVIWFDQARCDAAVDAEIEATLRRADASLEWSVKNQARMICTTAIGPIGPQQTRCAIGRKRPRPSGSG